MTQQTTSGTAWAKVYLSGPIEIAKQVIRKHCLEQGLCVTIEPTTFIYTGSEEVGYVVGVINYPRFPESSEEVFQHAKTLALALLSETYQRSALVMTPEETIWIRNVAEK